MSHVIDMSNYRENMAYVGAVPWHGLGQKLTEDAPLEVWAREAGMSHTIERARVAYRWGENSGEVNVMDDKHVLYRSDTKAPLSVVSPRYKIVQPSEILEFYRDLVDATGEYQLETAGLLDGGRKYWALARYRDSLMFGQDEIKPYLLLASSADGTMATTAQHTSVRVVCNNTLQMSLQQDMATAVKVSHSMQFDGDRVKSRLGVGQALEDFEASIDALVNKAITDAQAAEIFVEMHAKRDEHGEMTNEKSVKRVVSEIMASLRNAPGSQLDTARGTAWGAMNAVTHFVDFKSRAHSNNNRFSSGQFGQGAKLKQNAYKALLAA